MNTPDISVITVCRNAGPLLDKTMKSVAEQTLADIEYIVVDGVSTDGSVDRIKRNPAVTRWVSEPDKGIYDAMNKGVKMATGTWVIFMNAGDTFADPDTCSKLAKSAKADCTIVYGGVIKCNHEGEPTVHPAPEMRDSHRMVFCHQSSMVKRDYMIRHPFDISHRLSADFKLFKSAFAYGERFQKVDFPVSVFDTGGVSNSRRSAGLADNIKVIYEVAGPFRGLGQILHLLPTYLISRLRGK